MVCFTHSIAFCFFGIGTRSCVSRRWGCSFLRCSLCLQWLCSFYWGYEFVQRCMFLELCYIFPYVSGTSFFDSSSLSSSVTFVGLTYSSLSIFSVFDSSSHSIKTWPFFTQAYFISSHDLASFIIVSLCLVRYSLK